jgi:membrane carboxypeptidase/penicillin-binding protein
MRITGLGCGLFISIFMVAVLLALTGLYAALIEDLPSPEILTTLLEPPDGTLLHPTQLFDRTGTQIILTLAHPGSEEKQYITLDEGRALHIPPEMVSATIVASDPSFRRHEGYQLAGFRTGDHPTLAQRLIATLVLDREPPGLQRALRERLLAAQLTSRFGRDQVMEWFLNSADYGNLAYGVDAAARVYFGKPAHTISLAEAAILAAVAEAPALNPLDTPAEARKRGRDLLTQMLETGAITTAPFRRAMEDEPRFEIYPAPDRDPHAAFTDLVIAQLATQLGRERIERGGFRVITTQDYDLQLQSDCALQIQLALIEKPETGTSSPANSDCQAARLLQRSLSEEAWQSLDLTGVIVILQPGSGEILALAGDPVEGMDPSQIPGRPPGSLLAPYIHLAAYTRGLSPASLSWDIPSNIPTILPSEISLTEQFRGPIRLRTALANDYLVPSLHLLEQIGPANAWKNLPQLGLSSLQIPAGPEALMLVLDEGQASLLEMTHAYSAFSNLGVLAGNPANNGREGLAAGAILQVVGVDGQSYLDFTVTQSRSVISAQLAYLVHSVLSDETARWPTLGHPNLLEIGLPSGAKIGRTTSGRDSWTLGYTTQLAVGVWVGVRGEESEDNHKVPEDLAPGLWHAVIQYASRELPPEEWEQPPGISVVQVCDPSGLLPTPECPSMVSEVFINGNEPLQQDMMYREIQINRETGRLATIFTPPELIENRVFLVVPPEAAAWAAESGLPTPPDAYDLIFAPQTQSKDVRITQPLMFGYVRGIVQVRGTSSGADFDFYRLQYGQGLNPTNWIQLGEDTDRAVLNGPLGSWDTTGLTGLYAMKLQVIRADQRVETAVIQVTVDNQAPEIKLLNPTDGQGFSGAQESLIILRASGSDDLALAQVDFYLEDTLLATLTEAPFAIPWETRPGKFTLRVIATDQAGNTAETAATFTVQR